MSIQNVNGEEIETGVEESSTLKTVDRFYWRAQFEHQLSHLTMADDRAEIAKYIAYLSAKFMPTVPDAALTDTWVLRTNKSIPPGFVEELIQKEQIRRNNKLAKPKWLNLTNLVADKMSTTYQRTALATSLKPFYANPVKVMVSWTLPTVMVNNQTLTHEGIVADGIAETAALLDRVCSKYNVLDFKILASPAPVLDTRVRYTFLVETWFETFAECEAFNQAEETKRYRDDDTHTLERVIDRGAFNA